MVVVMWLMVPLQGLGVVCNKDDGLEKDEFVVEFFGEVCARYIFTIVPL